MDRETIKGYLKILKDYNGEIAVVGDPVEMFRRPEFSEWELIDYREIPERPMPIGNGLPKTRMKHRRGNWWHIWARKKAI